MDRSHWDLVGLWGSVGQCVLQRGGHDQVEACEGLGNEGAEWLPRQRRAGGKRATRPERTSRLRSPSVARAEAGRC